MLLNVSRRNTGIDKLKPFIIFVNGGIDTSQENAITNPITNSNIRIINPNIPIVIRIFELVIKIFILVIRIFEYIIRISNTNIRIINQNTRIQNIVQIVALVRFRSFQIIDENYIFFHYRLL